MDNNLQSKGKCGLLALLPKPKNTNPFYTKKENTKLLPQSLLLRKNESDVPNKKAKINQDESPLTNNIVQKPKAPAVVATVSSLVSYEGSSDESSDNECEVKSNNSTDSDDQANEKAVDFFGINSKPLQVPLTNLPDLSSYPSFETNEQMPENKVIIGPAKPESVNYSYPTLTDNDLADNPKRVKTFNEQQVTQMIYEKELALYGGTTHEAAEMASKIIDVSVDRELGPNIRQNLLKNLNNKALAQVAIGPLPKIKKDPSDRLSKQKHQITHLAGIAVAREEMLQEQWADNKQKKKASSRRYGF